MPGANTQGGRPRARSRYNFNPFESRASHENPRSREARRRLQRQGPGETGWQRRGYREREDVDESVRRDRRRGGRPAEGEGGGDRDRRGFLRPRGLPGDTAHGARARGRPRDPGGNRRRPAAAGGGEIAQGRGGQGTASARHSGQAGDRRRREPDRADAGSARRLASELHSRRSSTSAARRRRSSAKWTVASRRSRSACRRS